MDNLQGSKPRDDAHARLPMQTRAEIEAVLDSSEADVAAGRVVAMAPVLAKLRAIAEHIRQERATKVETLHPLT